MQLHTAAKLEWAGGVVCGLLPCDPEFLTLPKWCMKEIHQSHSHTAFAGGGGDTVVLSYPVRRRTTERQATSVFTFHVCSISSCPLLWFSLELRDCRQKELSFLRCIVQGLGTWQCLILSKITNSAESFGFAALDHSSLYCKGFLYTISLNVAHPRHSYTFQSPMDSVDLEGGNSA